MEKKYSTPRTSIPAEVERQIKVEAGHKCTVTHCNEHTYLEIHHIDENRDNNKLDNLILLCDKHHKMAHAKKIDRKALRKYKELLLTAQVAVNKDSSLEKFYRDIVDSITNELYLKYWKKISDNLISNSIEADVLEGFHNISLRIAKTDFPSTIVDLDNSVIELGQHLESLVRHFYDSEHAFLDDRQKFWSKDMRWKKEWLEQDEYQRKYDLADKWRQNLYILHNNLVVALNKYAFQVRSHIYPEYFMRELFSVIDSLGTYNMMQPFEQIPNEYTKLL